MERLREKGYLKRRKIRGTFHYSPKFPKSELLRTEVQRFVNQTLDGSLSPFIAYLSDADELTNDEFLKLKDLVAQLEERRQGGSA